MLAIARKAFAPARIPFPIMHVDTGLNFPEVLDYRDRWVEELGPAADRRVGAGGDRARPRPRGAQRLAQPDPDAGAARGGRAEQVRRAVRRRAARRGEGPRQGARLLVPRRVRPVGPQEPAARSSGACTTAASSRARASACSRCRTGPSSTSGRTSPQDNVEIAPLYFAEERDVVERDGMLYAVNEFTPLQGRRDGRARRWSATGRSATRT